MYYEIIVHLYSGVADEKFSQDFRRRKPGHGRPVAQITRLLHKKALAGTRKDGAYLYRPLIARADYVQAESQSLLDRLFQGQVAPLVAHFAKHRALTAADLRKLKKLIAEMEDEDD
jgi:predicted transcriptional regulator